MKIVSFDIGEKNFAYCLASDMKIMEWRNHDIIKNKNQTVILSCDMISEILDFKNWSDLDYVLIEQQFSKNIRAIRLSQHLWTWFRLKYPSVKIFNIPSSSKTQYFLGKNKLSNKERKTWSVEKTIEILKEKNESEYIQKLNSYKKKDDLSDCFLQLYIFHMKNN